jgi:membrane protein implicated in regulation of membrane protease activity
VLVIALTYFGRPIVQRWRAEGAASGLNERSTTLIGTRGEITVFKDGAGSVKIADTIWRAVSEEALTPGDTVVIASVDGATLKVKRAKRLSPPPIPGSPRRGEPGTHRHRSVQTKRD